jgi:hypothetical protein
MGNTDAQKKIRLSLLPIFVYNHYYWPSAAGERMPIATLMDQILRCPCSRYAIHLHDRLVHVLEEFVVAARARD